MPHFTDPKFRELNDLNRRAQELLDKGDFEAASSAFTEVKDRARGLGIDASWASWGLAICHHNLGEPELAFECMCDSLRVDPLNLGKQASFDMIVRNMRAALASPDRAPADPATPRLYRLLVSVGEVDVGGHLAMARHLVATGHAADAMPILEAVTTLFPADRQGWEARASVARALGDEPLARRCEVEAAGCPGTDAPFGMRRPAAVC